MMYLIPKNIKTKREIFKGFGIFEIIVIAISFGLGYILQLITNEFFLKLFLFILLPMTSFFLLLPLPNGSTALSIFKKFLIFKKRQKNYKYK